MSRFLTFVLGYFTLASVAFAKPACDDLLTLTRGAIQEFRVQPLNAYPHVFILFADHGAVGEVGEAIRARVGQRVSSKTLRHPGEVHGKRDAGDILTTAFVLIDSLESFITASEIPGAPVDVHLEHVERLRSILAQRMRTGRPTLIVIESPLNLNRYLMGLDQSAKGVRNGV